ncbi:GDP-mannose 4,6-dehydratase [Proteinivorax tanatarense]|uniref:UDP-glucose 4-epimerase n=1 Tax=Proteinivorax tanatarense TaxID=1260629 RepID=A0AAU7VS58_9FIRM
MTRTLKVLNGKYDNLKIYGTNYLTHDGTCIRDYIHVSDLVSAHIKALEYLIKNKTSDIFNLGYGRGYSVLEVVNVSEEVTGKKVPVMITGQREGDVDKVIADNQKAINKLNWKPQFDSLSDIIKTAWDWEKKITDNCKILHKA